MGDNESIVVVTFWVLLLAFMLIFEIGDYNKGVDQRTHYNKCIENHDSTTCLPILGVTNGTR
jgi:hypothetical protein